MPEVIYKYTAEAVVSPLVSRPDRTGIARQSGNAFIIPTMEASTIVDKVAGVDIVPSAPTEGKVTFNADEYKCVAHIIEEDATLEAVGNLMTQYGYQDGMGLAKQTDVDVSALITNASIPDVGAGTAITDALIREARKKLNIAGAPASNRYLVIDPIAEYDMLGIDKFVGVDKSGADGALRNGYLGRLYGFDVYVSNNLTVGANTSCMAFQQDAFGLIVAKDPTPMFETSALKRAIIMSNAMKYYPGVIRADYAVEILTTA